MSFEGLLLSERLSLVILGLAMGAQLLERSFLARHIKMVWRLAAAGYLALSIYWSWLLYHTWSSNTFTSFFLPPHTSWHYYVSNVAVDIFAPWVIALCAGIILGFTAWHVNTRYGERFFEVEEIPIFALGVFLAGYPGFIFYIPLVLLTELGESIYFTLRGKGRAPLYYLWLPLAILAIILKNWLVPASWLAFFAL